jgi:hypothetical protein
MFKILIVTLSIVLCSVADAKGGGRGYHSYNNGKVFSGAGSNSRSHYVKGYTTQQGSYVSPHYSTNPNRFQRDNYSTRGNYNFHNDRTGNSYVNR